jgi:hypothetical protein
MLRPLLRTAAIWARRLHITGSENGEHMKKQMTKAETIAECFRLVSEHERKLPPYERALFLQRLDRRLSARTKAETESRYVDGGCVVLKPIKFFRDDAHSSSIR